MFVWVHSYCELAVWSYILQTFFPKPGSCLQVVVILQGSRYGYSSLRAYFLFEVVASSHPLNTINKLWTLKCNWMFCASVTRHVDRNFLFKMLQRRRRTISGMEVMNYQSELRERGRRWASRRQTSINKEDKWNWRLTIRISDKRTKEQALAGYDSTKLMRLCWKASCRNDSQNHV